MAGSFIISLDFELRWGVRDNDNVNDYIPNLIGAREVIPKMISLFDQYQVRSTFATVGFLFFADKEELMQNLPKRLPDYRNKRRSPYGDYMNNMVGQNEQEDPQHFASSIIQQINSTKLHEIASHTFSHYYCWEEGQDVLSFKLDLEKSINVAKEKFNIEIKSIVFPRNEFPSEYLSICSELGVTAVRGIPKRFYSKNLSVAGKLIRYIDNYVNMLGLNTTRYEEVFETFPCNVIGNRMLKPYSRRFSLFESLKMKRIKNEMSFAAKKNRVYHLWWHPHNFGVNQEDNLKNLERLLQHYQYLNKTFDFQSETINSLANKHRK